MNPKSKFSLSLDIAADMIKCGGEIARAEETVRRINGKDCRVFALPTLIIAQHGNETQIRRIPYEETNLARLARLNSVSRRLCNEAVVHHRKEKEYSQGSRIIATCGATAAFCIYFGGGFTDAIISGIIGIAISFLSYKKIPFPLFSANLVDSFLAGIMAYLPAFFGISCNPNMIIIGTIMLLVPGLTIVNAIRDMMSSDLVSGLAELINAITSALAIALGISGGLIIFGGI